MFAAGNQAITPACGNSYWANVVAMLHCDGTNGSTTFTDSSPLAADFSGSGATISTTQSKFGGASQNISGNGQVGATASSSNFAFGTRDFTFEMWIYATSFSSLEVLYDQRPAGATGFYPTLYLNVGVPQYLTNQVNRIIGSALSTSMWHHIAVSRVTGNTRMFVDGTKVGSTYADTDNLLNSASRPILGNSTNPPIFGFTGYMDEVRVTKGVGRYVSNFAVQTAAFPNA